MRRVANLIIGAGAMGTATAYHLARMGQPVVLVDQFGPGHTRGSSHGLARITRHSYADPDHAGLMPRAFRAWKELEAASGVPLYIRCGGVSISPHGLGYVDQVASNLQALDVPHLRTSGSAWNRIHPQFNLRPDDDVVFEPDAGILLASRILELQVELARQLGGSRTEVVYEKPVKGLDLDGDRPRVRLEDEVIEAERVIVTAGAWTARLVPGWAQRLQPTRQQVLYFKAPNPEAFALGASPAFIWIGPGELNAFYGMPASPGAGVKVARHGGPNVDPDIQNGDIETSYVDEIRRFLSRSIPSLAGAPIERTEVCLYTMADQEKFQMGFYPGRSDVIVASPCSGHGFKFSNLVGQVLAELATTGQTSTDAGHWMVG